ncbi:PAS domain S-box protein [Rufibacter immobilis]|uniref:PAS domain S-box protein n=1 Tax=Rufibacter immobilis TaxID=1348778 RepID=UPI0035E5FA13
MLNQIDKPQMGADKNQNVFEKLVRHSSLLHCVLNRSGIFEYVSDASASLLGYAPEELTGHAFTAFLRSKDVERTQRALEQLPHEQQATTIDTCFHHKSGHEVPMAWSVTWSGQEEEFYCVGRDATEKWAVRRKVKEKEELHEALVEYGADMLALLNEEGIYTYVGGSTERILGYTPPQLVGKRVFDFIHPDDRHLVEGSFISLLQQNDYVKLQRFRFKAAAGDWRWVDTALSNQLKNKSIQSLVVSSRDMTEQMQSRTRLLENEQRYRNLFEKNPDAVFLQHPDGTVAEVNDAFNQLLGFGQDKIIGKPVSAFMSEESAALCSRYFEQALLGSTMRFDLELASQSGDRKILDLTMYPLTVQGSVMGIETIAKDITAIVRSYETIQQQAQKLNTILESITDAFFTLDHNLRFTFLNSEAERLLDIDRHKSLGRSIWEVFPDEVGGMFNDYYQQVQATKKAASFETSLKRKMIWLGVKFYPLEDGLSVYLVDITQRVKYENELKMLSLVASKTTNGIVIMNAQGEIQWVNEGFTNLNGYTLNEVFGKRPSDFLQGPKTDSEAAQRIFEKYEAGEPFSEEVLNYKKTGEIFWVRFEVTPVRDNDGKIVRFISVQTDITAQKAADESQAQLTRDLTQQNRDLQQFTYIVSHNLRAPVANAMGLAHLLNILDRTSPNFDTALLNLDKSMAALDTILKDLNAILSIGFNKGTLSQGNVDFGQICREAVESLHESIGAYGIKVRTEIAPNTFVYGNRAYLFSIVYNLLSNAIKYRSPERRPEITVKTTTNQQWVSVIFSDNGLGFDEEKVGDKIFRLYQRFHRDIEGRGLGLFLVKTQIDAMGGEIKVSSTIGVGTQFQIHLRPGNGHDGESHAQVVE